MDSSMNLKNTGEQRSFDIQKCSKIPIRVYPSDGTRKHFFIKNSFNTNRSPPILAEAKTETNSDIIINIEEGKEKKNKNRKKGRLPFPGFRKNVFEYCVEYANNSSIQGIKYMGSQTRPTLERFTWLAFFCLSSYFCVYLIIQTYIKWDTAPVLVSFSRSPTPIWKIPFPAVTICSDTKAKKSLYSYTKNYYRIRDNRSNMTQEEINKFSAMSLICDHSIYANDNLTIGYDTIEFLISIAPQFGDVIGYCRYPPYNTISCKHLFTPILTEEGMCFTFNMLDRTELFRDNVYFLDDFISHGIKSHGWTLETGYPTNVAIDTYPRRALSSGFPYHFTIGLMTLGQDLDYICKGLVHGFRILLHNPAETPRIGMNSFQAPLMQDMILGINPNMMTTSDALRNYDPHRRQCYFQEERYLAFFRSYSQQSCQIECITNFTRAKCGCVGHEMPHEEETPLCGSGNIGCMADARTELVRREVQWGIDKEALNINEPSECDCLPGCTSLVYNAEISQANLNLIKAMRAHNLSTNELEDIQHTRINIYLKESQFITTERNELFGYSDFIANCGGLLGVFIGFSFLSVVEILYFLSLRLICNIKKYGKHYWSGSQELMNNY